jgi:general secretion pathway protein G
MAMWRKFRIVRAQGFTLIELIVVMAIIALLLSIVAPRYMRSLEKSKEAVLKEDLWVMRDALDKYYGDLGKYPNSLDELVEQKYLRTIPVDPMTDSTTTWQVVPPADPELGAIYNVKSGASGTSAIGTSYSDW